MTVARNCAIQLSKKIDLKELKQLINKIVYPNLFKLLQVALILPNSSASCERSFSAMRRIKSWKRTMMVLLGCVRGEAPPVAQLDNKGPM
ncbi:hypothetical protein QTP88_016499 [Uroleucon formosanum]